jgi:F0F1-type ATP synthase membrane subunit b/b'
LWAERKRLLVEMQRIRDDADDRISTLRAEAKQLTLESVARKFECSITQIHHIIGES